MLPILDDHAHLSPTGKRADAVRQFEKAGGTHLIISHMPYGLKPILSKEDWKDEFDMTCSLTEEARRETGVRVFCVVGPYPVELLGISEGTGVEKAFRLMKEGIDVAAEYVKEQKAIGIGEVGRPHFLVDQDILQKSNELLLLCMERAKDLDCAVVVHSERANESNLGEFSQMAKKVGLKPERVVKHYCGKLDDDWATGEIAISVLSTQENVLSAIRQKLNFMMETDYLDDASRPGAVLALSTVPKRMKQFSQKGIIDEGLWRKIHIERPRLSYGIDTES